MLVAKSLHFLGYLFLWMWSTRSNHCCYSMTFVTFSLPINQPLVLLTENKTHCMQFLIYSYPAGEHDGKPVSSKRLQIFFLWGYVSTKSHSMLENFNKIFNNYFGNIAGQSSMDNKNYCLLRNFNFLFISRLKTCIREI